MVIQQQTMLSIAKLAVLAGGDDSSDDDGEDEEEDTQLTNTEDRLQAIDDELQLIHAQENLPESVADSYGFQSTLDMRVIPPKDLIELYIAEDNKDADVVEFRRALDLVNYLSPLGGSAEELAGDREAMRLKIWAMAVARDDWTKLDTAKPLESIKETLFFKLVDFSYLQGTDLEQEMPDADGLLDHDSLKSVGSGVHFLIRAGYEHIKRQMMRRSGNDDEEMMPLHETISGEAE